MIVRSKAPLRLGLAGGGTDVSPYPDRFGGAVLNATISMYAYASIIPRNDGKIVIHSVDRQELFESDSVGFITPDGVLDLHKGIYNRIYRDFTREKMAFELTTYVDAPPGSGLGSSSTLVTAIIGAFSEWLKLPLGDYDTANLAYEIERLDLGFAGGKQDQYAATFGGVNFMEFYEANKVIVNPLRIRTEILNELSHNLLLYYTGSSRLSSTIIHTQQESLKNNRMDSVEAMHKTKEMAVLIKEAILKSELDQVGLLLDDAWQFKKRMAEGISNPFFDAIYDSAKKAGALGGKISGAGGGGYMFFYCPENSRFGVTEALKKFKGVVTPFQFTKTGLNTWTI